MKKLEGYSLMIQNILITSAGRRVSLVKSFQKTLQEYNREGKVFATDMAPQLSSACQVSDGYEVVPRVTDRSYIARLKEICQKHHISLIVPTIDTELSILAQVKEQFLQEDITIAISSQEVCDTFYLKDTTEAFFLEHGFDTPKEVDTEVCDYPVFAKLNNSSCSIGAKVVHSQEEAKQMMQENPSYIFQEYIEAEEYTVDVFVDRYSNVISVVPRLRMEVRAGEVSKAKTVKDAQIIEEIKKLVSVLSGAYGCLTVQLFKKEDRIIFIEINPRFGGGYPLTYLSGANFADFLIKDCLEILLTYDESWKEDNIMLRYDAEVIVDGSGI